MKAYLRPMRDLFLESTCSIEAEHKSRMRSIRDRYSSHPCKVQPEAESHPRAISDVLISHHSKPRSSKHVREILILLYLSIAPLSTYAVCRNPPSKRHHTIINHHVMSRRTPVEDHLCCPPTAAEACANFRTRCIQVHF